MTSYDSNNIFARILRSEIPTKKIIETAHTLAFHDAFPKAPIHGLVIPKGEYINLEDFTARASDIEIIDFWRTCYQVIELLGLQEEGFRMISNSGVNGRQEVPHLHIHLCGGKDLGIMLQV